LSMNKKSHSIFRCTSSAPDWSSIVPAEIGFFFAHSSDHRPQTAVRLAYDDAGLHVRFDVQDRYVRAVAERYQDSVCKDSCVEFFVQPKVGGSYFNFEVNAGGILLLYRIPVAIDGTAQMDRLEPVPFELVREMEIFHSLPARVDPEITEPCEWSIEYKIPFELFQHYLGPSGSLAGQIWRANFYKCADATSHPHWGMWAPIPDGRRFHRPEYFGELIFDERSLK
jgi:hypothetical protein